MARRSREQEYERFGMTEDQRDRVVWEMRQRHVSRATIAKRLGITVEMVQNSLRRSGRRRLGQLP